ncbi:hypothetical protein, partial [Rhizobium leguminosarum]|uniref:hypothetical protein n=1 Tax=Rhizobium leguminosarum TaxID=384 RepID=UPI003F9A9CDF
GSLAARSSVFDEPTCFFQHFDLSGSTIRVAKTVLSGYLDGSFLKAKPRRLAGMNDINVLRLKLRLYKRAISRWKDFH